MLIGAVSLFGEAEKGPVFLQLLGRLHPGLVHFPIALLTVAAVLESWQMFRRRPTMSPATPVCLVLGALGALVASPLGWFLNEYEAGRTGTLIDLHMWIGFVATGVAILAAAFVRRAPQSPTALFALRGLLFTSAALVGATGYLGGDLLYGVNHLFYGLIETKKPIKDGSTPKDTKPVERLPSLATGKVDFARVIAPILTENCFRCHGGGKVRGKLDLKTRATAMKGGAGGPSIVPGKPAESPLYTALIDKDPEAKMPPPKEKPLSDEYIELIRKWIAEGADWPEGIELKAAE